MFRRTKTHQGIRIGPFYGERISRFGEMKAEHHTLPEDQHNVQTTDLLQTTRRHEVVLSPHYTSTIVDHRGTSPFSIHGTRHSGTNDDQVCQGTINQVKQGAISFVVANNDQVYQGAINQVDRDSNNYVGTNDDQVGQGAIDQVEHGSISRGYCLTTGPLSFNIHVDDGGGYRFCSDLSGGINVRGNPSCNVYGNCEYSGNILPVERRQQQVGPIWS